MIGSIKARWDINRNDYKVLPGLYAIGQPERNSEILVTANYKLTFDVVRKNLKGQNLWLLVLDTKGVNVWCAAGKGSFGTTELIDKMASLKINELVDHKKIILPQLGAPGVSAFKVKELTGFTVIFGPIKIADYKEFKFNDYKSKMKMKIVQFPINKRIKLVPVEIAGGSVKFILMSLSLLILYSFNNKGFNPSGILNEGINAFSMLLAGFIAGTTLTPILLPLIPVKAFSLKGAILGFVLALILMPFLDYLNMIEKTGQIFFSVSMASYSAMNFTGASTYTSLSGVLKEMKYAVPFQVGFAIIGVIIWLTGIFV